VSSQSAKARQEAGMELNLSYSNESFINPGCEDVGTQEIAARFIVEKRHDRPRGNTHDTIRTLYART